MWMVWRFPGEWNAELCSFHGHPRFLTWVFVNRVKCHRHKLWSAEKWKEFTWAEVTQLLEWRSLRRAQWWQNRGHVLHSWLGNFARKDVCSNVQLEWSLPFQWGWSISERLAIAEPTLKYLYFIHKDVTLTECPHLTAAKRQSSELSPTVHKAASAEGDFLEDGTIATLGAVYGLNMWEQRKMGCNGIGI